MLENTSMCFQGLQHHMFVEKGACFSEYTVLKLEQNQKADGEVVNIVVIFKYSR